MSALLALWNIARKLPTPVVDVVVELLRGVVAGESEAELKRRAEKVAWQAAYERTIRGGR